ncbi:MAG: Ribokinase, partial [Thermomicrobiales bacterium]|nr:Ribokinase [Thermomicrobiales bacterium]
GDDDFGRQRRADLDAEGIDTDSVVRSTTAASGVALIVVEEETGQNRISYVPGATMTLTPEQARAAVDRVKPQVVLTTLEPPPETLAALLDASRQLGATIVLNGTPEAIGAKPLLDRIDVLIVNETEAEDLLGHPVSASQGEDAARSLAALGPGTVVVTLGAAGAAVAHGAQTASFSAPRVDVVDTTGAGDAFCGASAADLARGLDPFLAARTGVVAGSLATTVPGAYPGIPRREAIQRMLAKS